MTLYKVIWLELLRYMFLFFVLMFTGTAGYMLLEQYSFLNALYMTVITLASVGYAETIPLSDVGKVFTMLLILTNLAILTYVITKVSRFLFDGEFHKLYKHLSMQKKIDLLKDHVIVCGCGQNGLEAIKELKKTHIPFVAIDKNEKSTIEEFDYHIFDDATKDEVLIKAGIMHAKHILITTPNDADNMFVVLVAKELNPDIIVICRATKDTSVKKLKTAGATNVIMPDKLGGVHMANLVLFPDVKEFIDVMSTYQNNGCAISELTPLRSQSLQAINSWHVCGATILGIKQKSGEYIINPAPDYSIQLSDRIIAIGSKTQLEDLKKII